MNEKKILFLQIVANTLAVHPNWMAETIQAIQAGMLERIEITDEAVANLAAGYSWTFMMLPSKLHKKLLPQSQLGLEALADFFCGAGIEKKIRAVLEESTS